MLSVILATLQFLSLLNATSHEPTDELKEIASLMEGSFSSEAQAKEDPEFFDIRLRMCRIWEDSSADGVWLYVEQAAATTLEKPYRQRIYHLSKLTYPGGDGKPHTAFVSEVWMLPGDPLVFAGGCDDPSKLAAISPKDLVRKDGCEVVLLKKQAAVYEGGTVGRECPSDRQGAAYTTSTVKVDSEALVTWDRGFNDAGSQVWGSVKGPYRFKRVDAQPSANK